MKWFQCLYINLIGLFLYSNLSFAQGNLQISTGAIFEGEPFIVCNPNNGQHLISAWMGFQLNQKITIKSSVSFNGGTSWSTPIFQSHLQNGYSSADVSLGFGLNGSVFMCYIDYDNVTFASGQIVVRKSTDGGLTWGSPVEAVNVTDCPSQLCIDRPWMVVDHLNSGNIYVTSMNADQPALVTPPYHPYLTISSDGGQTFGTPKCLDTLNYLAGNTISQPTASPTLDGNGNFYGIYPSYLLSQSPWPQQVLASTQNGGISTQHHVIYQGTQIGVSQPLKRAGKLCADQAHAGHIAYVFLSQQNDQSDVYMMETFDGGTQWTPMTRVNQDPVNVPRVQDLVWADFNESGDLLICWRDRRNASADGYNQASEIFAASKIYGNSSFGLDYALSSQAAAHDTILEGSGNDFMSVCFQGDTAYAVWGDVRSGNLKIYLNKWNVLTQAGTSHVITDEEQLYLYPNPVENKLTLPDILLNAKWGIYNERGELVLQSGPHFEKTMHLDFLKPGSYYLESKLGSKIYKAHFTKV